MDRRSAIKNLPALAVASTVPTFLKAQEGFLLKPIHSRPEIRKIATEEAFVIPEIAKAFKGIVQQGSTSLDNTMLKQIYDPPVQESTQATLNNELSKRDKAVKSMLPKLLDFESVRMVDMDANNVTMHLLSLTSPGVQMFETSMAITLARLANDRLSEIAKRHPNRFAGLACFAPQDPGAAAKEMERSIKTLNLNGFVVNSHTDNLYLDNPRFLPILEAAEALDAPIYIHPRAPSNGMAVPFQDYRMEGPLWGYGIETSTHILRLIFGGIFDRFPKLQVVIGHMGEALPFWLWRLDFMGSPGIRAGLKNVLKPSEYFQRNISITTSGVEDPLALRYSIDKIGADRIMWAIDYPYQPTAPAVSFIETAPLTETERAKIAYSNAERIFKIKS